MYFAKRKALILKCKRIVTIFSMPVFPVFPVVKLAQFSLLIDERMRRNGGNEDT